VREIFVWREVNNLLWQKLEKVHYDKVRDKLFRQLENDYEKLRKKRHPDDETLFVCWVHLPEGNNWHSFEFRVDDTMTDSHLFVVGVRYHLGRMRFR